MGGHLPTWGLGLESAPHTACPWDAAEYYSLEEYLSSYEVSTPTTPAASCEVFGGWFSREGLPDPRANEQRGERGRRSDQNGKGDSEENMCIQRENPSTLTRRYLLPSIALRRKAPHSVSLLGLVWLTERSGSDSPHLSLYSNTQYYPRLTLDFHTNKRICDEVAIIPSKRLRNKIAGFTTHLMKRIQKGPVRGISFKLQEEERERKDVSRFVPTRILCERCLDRPWSGSLATFHSLSAPTLHPPTRSAKKQRSGSRHGEEAVSPWHSNTARRSVDRLPAPFSNKPGSITL